MVNIIEILSYTIGSNSIGQYVVALAVFLLAVLLLRIFKYVIIKRIKYIVSSTTLKVDNLLVDIVDGVGWSFYVLLSLYVALKFIRIPGFVEKVLYYLVLLVVTFYAVKSIQRLIDYSARKIIIKKEEEDEAEVSIIDLLSKILKGVLWLVAALFILQNMGYHVSTLVAGLGIGGLAVAIALQNVLSDVFSSFSIYFDKPFKVGDFLIVGNDLGVVKRIGIKTTRLESLWGQEIVISNAELTSTRINNYKKMERRRVHFTFGVTYQTTIEKIKKVLEIVREIYEEIELADLDRVHFKEFGNFSLNFEVAYYVGTGDYVKYMDVQQEVNLALKERFEKEGIEFAYPTQTVFINKG